VYQAWQPFLLTYLRSGANIGLAEQWLPVLGGRDKTVGPAIGTYSEIYTELLRMNRSNAVEAFEEYQWEEVEDFLGYAEFILNNIRAIKKILTDPSVTKSQLDALLACGEGQGYSEFFGEAVYLYRHCQFDLSEFFLEEKTEIERQAQVYCDVFFEAFEEVASFCDAREAAYSWYCLDVKRIITRAWQNATRLDGSFRAIDRAEAMSLPVRLSEELTTYLGDLPCLMDLEVNGEFVFNAMQAALQSDAVPQDRSSFYAYTLPMSQVSRLFKNLHDFYDDVHSGDFFRNLLRKAESHATRLGTNMEGFTSRYIAALQERGYPVKEG